MLVLTYLFICIGMVTAQTQKVSGVVISEEDNLPIVGASVIVQGTTMGTITDYDGKFTLLNVSATAKNLEVSFVGMKSKTVAIKEFLKISLAADAELLDEVLVTGYGNFKKSSFTGSASNLNTEKLQDVPALSVSSKLAGGVSGVQITSTSGQPGAVESVRIRGMGSINASNEPLYVIDGVPMYNGDVSGFSYSQGGSGLLSTINTNDIESMTVIKDAAAASLYGSRAANGVIVITTKRGSAGKTDFNFKSNFGFSNMAINYRPVLGGEARRELLHLGLYNAYMNNETNPTPAAATAYADKNIDKYAAKPWSGYTDWRDILFQNGFHQNYEFSAQGGSDKTKFYSSMSYTKQEGITKNSGYERITGSANVNHKANNIALDFNSMISYSNQSQTSEGSSFASPIMATTMSVSPSSYPYNKDGSYSTNFPAVGGANIVQTMDFNYDKNSIFRSLSTASASWNIWDNLSIKEVFNFDFNQANNRVWWDPRSNDGKDSKGVFQRYIMNRRKWSSQTQLTYDKVFAEKHAIDVLAGFETEDYKMDYVYANGSNYPGYMEEITNAAITRASSNKSQYRMVSFLGRFNYSFDNKYYFSASYRKDGSSRLASDSRWGDFWSVSGSWRLTQEKFMEGVLDVLTDAKLRASYGVNGTQPSDYYGYMGLFEYGSNYNGLPGGTQTRIYNPNLSWEKNYATNIGIDVTLWNRLSISFDWYNRNTKDLLLDQPISLVTGFESILKNVGAMRNRGFEIEIKSTNISKNDWHWTTSFNLGHNNNKLTKLVGNQTEMIDANGLQIHRVGKPYNSFYVYEYAGVDPATGKESYYINDGTANDRKTTTDHSKAHKVIVGDANPTVAGGLSNFVSWKDFDLNFTFTYSFGGKAYDRAKWIHSNGGTYHYDGNIPSFYKLDDTWKKPGDNAKLPQFVKGNTFYESSRWLFSTNHVRLKNITLGYKLPNNIIRKVGLNKLRAYASASNLFTIKSKNLYFDPEVPANGLVRFETPALRTVTFGIEVGF